MADFRYKYKSNLTEAILKFKHTYSVSMPLVIHDVMRQLIQTFWQFSPPKTKSQGVTAIRNDFRKNYVDARWFSENFIARKTPQEQTRIRRYFRDQDWTQLENIKADGGMFQHVYFRPFSKGDIHRNSRGRIIKTNMHTVCTTPEALQSYIKEKEAKVGRFKGAMVAAYEYFGGKQTPTWVKKNAEGTYEDHSKGINLAGASATSLVPYGRDVDNRYHIIDRVYQAQAHKLEGQVRTGVLNKALTSYYGL